MSEQMPHDGQSTAQPTSPVDGPPQAPPSAAPRRSPRGTRRTGRSRCPGSTSRRCPMAPPGINVAGKRLASPIQGFGKMWQKTYQVRLPASRVSAQDLIATWKQQFPDFWPEGNHFYGPLTGIAPGEVALIDATLPGRLKLSTGVMVLYADEESFTLMTPQGHMFAGWITFSATDDDAETVAQAQVLMRASDPIFELGLMMGGHRQEDGFWQETLGNLARHFDMEDAGGRHRRGLRGQEAAVAPMDQRVALLRDPLDALHAERTVPRRGQAVARHAWPLTSGAATPSSSARAPTGSARPSPSPWPAGRSPWSRPHRHGGRRVTIGGAHPARLRPRRLFDGACAGAGLSRTLVVAAGRPRVGAGAAGGSAGASAGRRERRAPPPVGRADSGVDRGHGPEGLREAGGAAGPSFGGPVAGAARPPTAPSSPADDGAVRARRDCARPSGWPAPASKAPVPRLCWVARPHTR